MKEVVEKKSTPPNHNWEEQGPLAAENYETPADYAPVADIDREVIKKDALPLMSESYHYSQERSQQVVNQKVFVQPQKGDMPKHDKEDKSNDLSVKKQYVSRRVRDYDDTDSAGEGDESDDDDKAALDRQDTGVIQYVDTKGNTTTLKPNLRFLGFKNIFQDLLKQTSVVTMYPIVSMIISFDSTKAITLTKKDDRNCFVK